jgi:NCS2 family nucleobase:cation symporter-2
MVIFIAILFPVVIVHEMGANISLFNARSFISLTMIAGGLTTILQALKKGTIGSGYLCPAVCGPSYYSASVMAVHTGGLSLLFGMTGFVGFVEVLFSRIMHKLRFLFPTEVTGTVVTLVGIVIIPLAVQSSVGLSHQDHVIDTNEIVVAVITFGTMVGLNVFTRGKLKLYCAIIGMVTGYVAAIPLGVLTSDSLQQVKEASMFSLPYIKGMSWSFKPSLMIPFIVAALCSTLKTVGDIAACQKINDTRWKRPDMNSISKGILVDGIGGVLPGLLGGYGQSTSSTNVGLSVATGATSRYIAFSAGGILIFLAFCPKLANIFLIMPLPVMGSALIFAIGFMILQGIQIIMSRMLDARKIFVVGTSLILGLSADMIPHVYDGIHSWLEPVFSSSLSLGAVSAVLLNLLLRIGISKKKKIILHPGEESSTVIFDFMEKQGSTWGARREVIFKASSAINELMEALSSFNLAENPVNVEVIFDELNLDVIINYKGKAIKFPSKKPTSSLVAEDEEAALDLSGFMIKKYTDKASVTTIKDGVKIQLHFEH